MEDTTIEDVLKTVEALHNQKDYQGALRALESNQGKISAGLWHYNMGTILGKMENFPLARFHLMMADSHGYTRKELFQNKEYIETKLDISRLEKPLSTTDYLVKGSLFASQGLFTMLSLIMIILGVISFIKKAGIAVFGTCLLTAGLLLGANFWIQSWDKVIVVEAQAIHEGPSTIFGAREEIPSGVMLVTKKTGEWRKIYYPARFSGWIKESGLKELK